MGITLKTTMQQSAPHREAMHALTILWYSYLVYRLVNKPPITRTLNINQNHYYIPSPLLGISGNEIHPS